MGIAPYKTFTFDGESSADYGVYITGTGVFNAPERSVEMIDIPNRNGAYALDRGRFENIEVTYNVGIVDDNEADFADRVSDFRNWLCSKVGYCRLEDEYNPDEYRMALYSSGVNIDHDLLIAGEAEITFNCKPQRWLKSGETAVTVADGGTIDNPTLFDANPLLALYGEGTLYINSDEIVLENDIIGNVVVVNSGNGTNKNEIKLLFSDFLANAGDDIKINSIFIQSAWGVESGYGEDVASVSGSATGGAVASAYAQGEDAIVQIALNNITYQYGTANTITVVGTFSVTMTDSVTGTGTLTVSFAYDGDKTITITKADSRPTHFVRGEISSGVFAIFTWSDVILDSTENVLGNPLYIDLDIGEAYKVVGGVPISVNNAFMLPSDLPTLKPGTNTITYDNTFTQVDIVPRWWRV